MECNAESNAIMNCQDYYMEGQQVDLKAQIRDKNQALTINTKDSYSLSVKSKNSR